MPPNPQAATSSKEAFWELRHYVEEMADALECGDEATETALGRLGLVAPPSVEQAGVGLVSAIALAVTLSCNLACAYSYAN